MSYVSIFSKYPHLDLRRLCCLDTRQNLVIMPKLEPFVYISMLLTEERRVSDVPLASNSYESLAFGLD